MALMGLLPRLLLALVLPLASASPSPPSRPRDGAAPPGVPLAAALATARALQPELFGALPASFLPQFRANCWYLNSTGGAATALDAAVGSQLRCLPSFFVLGSFQCGVRDLASRLAHHPLVAAAPSPHWWDESKPWSAYWPHFSQAAARADRGEAGLHVGDSSAATFAFMWSASQRTNRPFSEALQRCAAEGCAHDTACVARRCYAEARGAWHPLDGDGSKLSTPWLVRLALGGGVRHVVLLRDPVERLHAAFWAGHHYHARYGASEAGFAAFANETLADFAACERAGHGRDGCALAFEAWGKEQEAAYFHCGARGGGAAESERGDGMGGAGACGWCELPPPPLTHDPPKIQPLCVPPTPPLIQTSW